MMFLYHFVGSTPVAKYEESAKKGKSSVLGGAKSSLSSCPIQTDQVDGLQGIYCLGNVWQLLLLQLVM